MPDESEGSGSKKPVDLRFTSVDQSGVSINRDMSQQGHLARGSKTNMSNMRFSVKAQPRDYLDPELQALRPADSAPLAEPRVKKEYQPPAPAAAASAGAPDPTPGAGREPVADAASSGGLFGAIKRLFS